MQQGGGKRVSDETSKVEENDMLGPEPSYTNVVSGYHTYIHDKPFPLDYGNVLPSFQIAYETWGTLNADQSLSLIHIPSPRDS